MVNLFAYAGVGEFSRTIGASKRQPFAARQYEMMVRSRCRVGISFTFDGIRIASSCSRAKTRCASAGVLKAAQNAADLFLSTFRECAVDLNEGCAGGKACSDIYG